ncbi:MAG TPA: DNA topoisomerase 4 subunit A, partial [Chloroflexi bacterium]|nr:DNA topoisomerase 4 subunit A [Chloroflexota bacterium]
MEIGLVRSVDIDREMQQSYLDYAMSVIVSRALPDARDGLKPVQRRILYAMYDMGLRPDSPYKKSARIVGEVLGKYHPHGDLAVYEAMARMAQDFSMRETLVDGQGNFGSVDGDPPAAMRYTEARLTALATQMLNQLDRDTVDFHSNFDETLQEPEVLPAAVPNLLVNGGSGIAVGMATSIPPHNMQEVVDALVYMLRRWEELDEVSVSDLMQYIKGPDFPTGGIILLESDKDDLLTAYATGRGRIIVRGRVHVEEMGRGRSRIIITELPYQTNKSALMERIAELAREGHLEGIADLRDESDRQGMRIVIDLNKAAEQDNVLRELYRRTSLQSTFRISLLALVDNEPRLLSLKQALRVYLEHRMTVVRRRSEFDLNKARQRAHILAGLRIAIQNLDEIIQLIRRSQDADQARQRLMRQYKLDEAQAQAILDMPLRRLAALERKKIEDEYKELLKTIRELEDLLASPKKMRQVIETELLEVRAQFGDQRRTQIVKLEPGQSSSDLLTVSALTPGQEVWVGVTSEGCLGRVNAGQAPSLDGGMGLRWVFKANSHHTLVLVNVQGKAASIPAHALPEVTRFDDGAPYHKVSPLPEGEELAAVFALPNGDQPGERYLVTASRNGLVKKSAVSELPGPSGQAFTAVKVNEGDEIATAVISDGSETLFLATAKGMAIRFSEQEVRPMGLVAAGVNGIKLAAGDFVVSMLALDGSRDVYLFSSDGKVWRTPAN